MRADQHRVTSSAMPRPDNYLHVSPVRQVSSAPQSRSCSFKQPRRRSPDVEVEVVESRRRTYSLPSRSAARRHGGASDSSGLDKERDHCGRLCRVRSFKQTSKGLVNHGDTFKRPSLHSLMSTGSATTDLGDERPRTLSLASETSSGVGSVAGSLCAPSYFRVVLLGSPGVGKSAILRQFMTSEYRGTFDMGSPEVDEADTTVSVFLDGEESVIEFIDDPTERELETLRADGYVVVFSLADPESYRRAVSCVRRLRMELGLDRAVLLVGNKVDLARQRRVALREARLTSLKYECQYEETSAALNHHVDELLVSLLSHIRHKLDPLSPSHRHGPPQAPTHKRCTPSPRRAFSFLTKLFQQARNKAKSCDNLLAQ